MTQLDPTFQPSKARVDLAYVLDEPAVWGDDFASLTAESFEPVRKSRDEPHSVYIELFVEGWGWRCETCGHHGRGFQEELSAVGDAHLHGRIVEAWA